MPRPEICAMKSYSPSRSAAAWGRNSTSNLFILLGFQALGVVLPEPLEDFLGRDARPRIGECFVDLFTQPIVKRGFLAIERAQARPQHFAGRSIRPGVHPFDHAIMQIAQGDRNRATRPRHAVSPPTMTLSY